jgi:hypothetical protein
LLFSTSSFLSILVLLLLSVILLVFAYYSCVSLFLSFLWQTVVVEVETTGFRTTIRVYVTGS